MISEMTNEPEALGYANTRSREILALFYNGRNIWILIQFVANETSFPSEKQALKILRKPLFQANLTDLIAITMMVDNMISLNVLPPFRSCWIQVPYAHNITGSTIVFTNKV